MMSVSAGIYPGTFDPITFGHIDIIKRAVNVVDKLIIAVAKDIGEKSSFFTVEERVQLISDEILELDQDIRERIIVKSFEGLLIDYARTVGANVLIRGLRAVSDFEYEFQMAGMNARLAPDLETVFLMASDKYQLISSRLVKEIAVLGGDVSHFVTPRVGKKLTQKLSGTHAHLKTV